MARKKSSTLTEGELRIMDALWRLKEGSVREVTSHLETSEPLAYNTVLTMLGILEEKGYVSHHKEGRAFVYKPTVTRNNARTHALKHLVQKFFDGSPEALVQNLLSQEDIDPEEVKRLRDAIEKTHDE
ncbi:MAG: BlaI/MecI/CopY family transcriptional regulator [Pseudomonadota bacterium]